MQCGGLFEESKWEIYGRMPLQWTPKTVLYKDFLESEDPALFLKKEGLGLPIILKPDRGLRGKGVELVHTVEDLLNRDLPDNYEFILQAYSDLPEEAGILCLKDPRTNQWKINSLMYREFITLKGDGRSTIEQLLRADDRYFLQLQRLRDEKQLDWGRIPEKEEELFLEEIGNHRLGTRFRDGTQYITPALEKALATVCDQIEGFEYGRIDIRFKSWEALERLEDLALIEVNGVNAEPGHIYEHGLLRGVTTLLRSWHTIFKMALHHNRNGAKPLPLKPVLKMFADYRQLMRDFR